MPPPPPRRKSIFAQADEELAALEAAHSGRARYPALRSIGGWFVFWSWVNWLVGAAVLLGGVSAALYYRKDFPLPSGFGALSCRIQPYRV